ncbi:MAG: VWA domain-containing protein [Planctomycetota bacterium]|nr:VWA domain-containing protein [Planctomycetota bacterium]
MHERQTTRGGDLPVDGSLAAQVQEVRQQQKLLRQARLRNLLLWAVLLSILFHIGLMICLHLIERARAQPPVQEFQVSIASLLPEEELTDLPDSTLQQPAESTLDSLDDLLDSTEQGALTADSSAAELEFTGVGATPTLGGAGARGNVEGLGGSGAAGSFFGITTAGRRFAYIVDRSGSMEGDRMKEAKKELLRSIRSLPDYAKFYIVFYGGSIEEPEMQESWLMARSPIINGVSEWIRRLNAAGGTIPLPAFRRVFGLDERPDVIFFLTDGDITSMSAQQVAELNDRGLRTVINTIAFGDDASQDLLVQIAQDSGGVYRFVDTSKGRRP